ncbi:MAG: DinB family protein [Gemmatimonadaceae bacterium]
MASEDKWREIVASSLDWEQAHATLDSALGGLSPDLRGKRADQFPHSVWELTSHIQRTQHDLLEFCRNPHYQEIKWPDDYWPKSAAPANDAEWLETIDAIHRDTKELAEFTKDASRDLTERIPHGTGQTYLRTVLLAVDHMSYHVGQIIAVRHLLGAWPAA